MNNLLTVKRRTPLTITNSGNCILGSDNEIFFQDEKSGIYLSNVNVTCGNNCVIYCGENSNIKCGNDCVIYADDHCNIECGKNCFINLYKFCYIKAGKGSKIDIFNKKISKDEEDIWWYIDCNLQSEEFFLINTFEDVYWKASNSEKYKDFYQKYDIKLFCESIFTRYKEAGKKFWGGNL